MAHKHPIMTGHLLSSAPTITSEYATRYAKGAAASWRQSVWPVIACIAGIIGRNHLLQLLDQLCIQGRSSAGKIRVL